jgi:hypothetical protein
MKPIANTKVGLEIGQVYYTNNTTQLLSQNRHIFIMNINLSGEVTYRYSDDRLPEALRRSFSRPYSEVIAGVNI